MSAMPFNEFSLNLSVTRHSIEIREGRARAKLVFLGRRIASNRRQD